MSNPVPVQPLPDASPLPVFHSTNLPGHAANPDTDAIVQWPVSPYGVAFMPMSGTFMVQAADGSQAECTDGFLTVGADGFPVWSAKAPS